MFSKNITVALALVCLAAVALSASLDELKKLQWFKLDEGGDYSVCTYLAGMAKSMGAPMQWRRQVDNLCSSLPHEQMINKCKRTVARYFDDMDWKYPEDFCKQINMIDATQAVHQRHLPTIAGDHSVCKFLVGIGKSLALSDQLRPQLGSLCSLLHTQDMIDRCKKTVVKYTGDMDAKSAPEFCSQLNLVDVE